MGFSLRKAHPKPLRRATDCFGSRPLTQRGVEAAVVAVEIVEDR
jgi:hypothetical protein